MITVIVTRSNDVLELDELWSFVLIWKARQVQAPPADLGERTGSNKTDGMLQRLE